MTATDRLVVWLREAMDAAERRADRWHDVECLVHATSLADAVVLQGATLCACDGPAAVLRRITADRKLLDLHAPTPSPPDGPYDPPVTICRECTGDLWAFDPNGTAEGWYPCATVRLLAEGYGWTEEEHQ